VFHSSSLINDCSTFGISASQFILTFNLTTGYQRSVSIATWSALRIWICIVQLRQCFIPDIVIFECIASHFRAFDYFIVNNLKQIISGWRNTTEFWFLKTKVAINPDPFHFIILQVFVADKSRNLNKNIRSPPAISIAYWNRGKIVVEVDCVCLRKFYFCL